MRLLTNALCLLAIVVRGQDDVIPDYKALAAQLDFNDPTVSVFEMRRTLVMAMAHPIPNFVMDDDLRDFEPTEEMKVMSVPDGRYIMQVFGGGEENLREADKKKLKEFRNWLTENNLKLPKGFEDNLEAFRVYASRDNNKQKAYDAILAHDKDLRERVFPILRDFDSYRKHFEKGFYYAYGRDKERKRPIVILNFRKCIDSGVDMDTLFALVDIMSNYMIEVGTIPGKIETWHTIIEVAGLSMWEIPIKMSGQIAMHLTKTNFARSATLHFTNVPKIVEYAARIVYNFLDDFMSMKTTFWVDNFKPKFKEMFGKNNLEKKYGGKLPNKERDFWPPVLNIKSPKFIQATPTTEESSSAAEQTTAHTDEL